MAFPVYKQLDTMDCGSTCLRMVARYYGQTYSLQTLRERSVITRLGVSLLGISDAAETIGLRTLGARLTFEQLAHEVPLPCIVHWKQQHFVVVYKIKKDGVHVADPGHGLITYTKQEFLANWLSTKREGEELGIALLLEPTPDFYIQDDEHLDKSSLAFLFFYLKPYKRYIAQLFVGMLTGSLLQLVFPFLTQSLVDFGINHQNLNFIYLVLIAQLMLFFSRMSVDFIRGWILLHISTRINISIISDFLIKLMKLPVGFFDTKMIGDIKQRIEDHHRIEAFLTSSTLSILFSLVNLVVFGIVLAIYNLKILGIFLGGSLLYVLWIVLFLKKRRELDFKRFAQLSDNQNNIIQLITGMQEIKLNNCEKQKRWEWEHIQAKLFKVRVKSLSLRQYQHVGAFSINQTKNILITFFTAEAVIEGHMTLGMMLAVQYILGQLNSPIEQMIEFLHTAQDAKISLERLGEIHQQQDEESPEQSKISLLPSRKDLVVSELAFQYAGPHSERVLEDIALCIPAGKVTAIVGTSGSGKTTLLKLLLGFYPLTHGKICIGETNLNNLSERFWRSQCGVVMQDGFIFSDTIAKNIAVSDEVVDTETLLYAVRVANIQEFIESLPLGYNTKIGAEGHGLSQGQKQRILIARAVYKHPEYLFFDEATNALDANNERVIMTNLEHVFKGRTVVVVAHRLSTVKHADQIVVLEKGRIIETGTHQELARLQGAYYHLVKNQLELGS